MSTSQPCGNATVYCTSGSPVPTAVLTGWYSTPDGLFDEPSFRSGTQQCAAGEFCVGGVRAPCPGGKYSGDSGQTSCVQCLAGAWLHASLSCAPLTAFKSAVRSPLCRFLLLVSSGFACPERTGALTVAGQGCTLPSLYCPAGSSDASSTPSGYYATGAVVGLYSSVTECEAGRFVRSVHLLYPCVASSCLQVLPTRPWHLFVCRVAGPGIVPEAWRHLVQLAGTELPLG